MFKNYTWMYLPIFCYEGKSFRKHYSGIVFREHLSEKHELKLSAHNKIYKCPFCDEFFDRKSPLLMHKKEAHPGQTNYVCDDCGKKCHTPSELNIHRRMHTGW